MRLIEKALCSEAPGGRWRHAISRFKRAVSMEIASQGNKKNNILLHSLPPAYTTLSLTFYPSFSPPSYNYFRSLFSSRVCVSLLPWFLLFFLLFPPSLSLHAFLSPRGYYKLYTLPLPRSPHSCPFLRYIFFFPLIPLLHFPLLPSLMPPLRAEVFTASFKSKGHDTNCYSQ